MADEDTEQASFFFLKGVDAMNFNPKLFKRYTSILTNGEDSIPITGGRFACGIDLPRGWTYSIMRIGPNEYEKYLNGKKAWIEIKEIEE